MEAPVVQLMNNLFQMTCRRARFCVTGNDVMKTISEQRLRIFQRVSRPFAGWFETAQLICQWWHACNVCTWRVQDEHQRPTRSIEESESKA